MECLGTHALPDRKFGSFVNTSFMETPQPRLLRPRTLAGAGGVLLVVGVYMHNREGHAIMGKPQQNSQTVCAGDTRGDKKCSHDSTHRVCAEIGLPDTSFWRFTGQHSWCNTRGGYSLSPNGNDLRCPTSHPTWCICKWATASWIRGEGCTDAINIDCDATDICATQEGLYYSYSDFNQDLMPARKCVKKKCPAVWAACEGGNQTFSFGSPVQSQALTSRISA